MTAQDAPQDFKLTVTLAHRIFTAVMEHSVRTHPPINHSDTCSELVASAEAAARYRAQGCHFGADDCEDAVGSQLKFLTIDHRIELFKKWLERSLRRDTQATGHVYETAQDLIDAIVAYVFRLELEFVAMFYPPDMHADMDFSTVPFTPGSIEKSLRLLRRKLARILTAPRP